MTSGKRLAVAVGIGLLTVFGSVSAAQAQYRGQRPYYGAPPPVARGVYRSGLMLGGRDRAGVIVGPNCCGICGGGGHGRAAHRRHAEPAPGADGRCLRASATGTTRPRGRLGLQQHLDDRPPVLGDRHHLAQGWPRLSRNLQINDENTPGVTTTSVTKAASASWARSASRSCSRTTSRWTSSSASRHAFYAGGDLNNIGLHGRLQLVLSRARDATARARGPNMTRAARRLVRRVRRRRRVRAR